MRFDEVSDLLGQIVELKRWPNVAFKVPHQQPLIRESGRLILVSVRSGSRDTLKVSDLRSYMAAGFIQIRTEVQHDGSSI